MHEGSELKKGLKYTIRTELMYKWITENEKGGISHKVCGQCNTETKFIELKSCKDPFLSCNCSQFYSKRNSYCSICSNKIVYKNNNRPYLENIKNKICNLF